MPPTSDNQLKFIRDIPFRNTIDHQVSGQRISVPFTSMDRSQWTSPDNMLQGLKDEIATVINGIYGKEGKDLKPHTYRLCWYVSSVVILYQLLGLMLCNRDATTSDNNWFISPHPRCENLYIATGGNSPKGLALFLTKTSTGSWHGWKFLPITGEYVVQMLKGELPEEMRQRWAWDRDLAGIQPNPMMPTRELRDIKV